MPCSAALRNSSVEEAIVPGINCYFSSLMGYKGKNEY